MDTVFYKTEGIICRERERTCPEILHGDGVWRRYPEMDPMHDARKIGRGEAVAMLPKGKPKSLLDAPGTMDSGVRAPL
jgi:hypothetical protein